MADYKTRLYRIWQKMKARCYNPNHNFYERYGGRGISICEEWLHDFKAFKAWALRSGYSDELSIDRIDVNGNYTPFNCRWVNAKVQANNTSRNHFITYNGETKTLSEWAESLGINKNTLHVRIDVRGWSIERAFQTIPDKPIKYNSDEERSISQKKQKHNYYERNKDVINKKSKMYYEKNKNKILQKSKTYRTKNKEHESLVHKIYREKNKEKIALLAKEYRISHSQQIKESKLLWYKKHNEEVKKVRMTLCNDPRNPGHTCTLQSLIIFASRHKDNPLVNNMSPSNWARQFIL